MKYIRNLHAKDDRIYNSSPQLAKHTRPYIGIIVTCNGQKYCIPLTSFKPKHENMSDRIDFSRIIINSKIIAALNLSRMIPVETSQLSRIDTKIRKHDTSEIAKRKQLYRQELQWCNKNRHSRKPIRLQRFAILYITIYIAFLYISAISSCVNTTGLLAMLAAETFIQFSAIQGISFSSMPRSESLTSRSRFFRRVLIFGAKSSAVIPPNILAIFANLK